MAPARRQLGRSRVARLAINSYAQQAIAFGQCAAHGVHSCLVVGGVRFRLLNGAILNMFYRSNDLHRMIVSRVSCGGRYLVCRKRSFPAQLPARSVVSLNILQIHKKPQ